MELTPTLILNLALLIVPPVVLVLVFRQWLARHIRWTVALTALCDVLLFWDELFYYESFGLFAVLILVQLAATGAQRSAFTTNKERIEFYKHFTDYRPEKVLRHRTEYHPRP